MAQYKKNRHSGFRSAPKVNKKRLKQNNLREDILMTSSETQKPRKNMKVVKGKKLETQRRFKRFSLVALVIIAALLICEWCIPAGVVESLSNTVATIGSGSYPISLESSTTLNAISKGSYYYVLTGSSIEAYSSGGKRIFTHTHGFEKPVLKTSKTRAIVFGQNSTEALIFTLSGLQNTVETKEKIKTAAIGDNGSYALVTADDSYAAKVSVFKKNGKLLYEWFSSQDLVNNVALAPHGNKMAVSTISSAVGTYNSKLLCFNFKSSSPEYQKSYENTLIYTLDTSFGGGFSVITDNGHDFIKWSNYKTQEYKNDYTTAMFRSGNGGMAVVYNRENDKTDNRIAVFSKSGKLKYELKFKGIITDFALKDGHIYTLSDSKVNILANDGSIMRSADYGFGAVRICPFSQSTAAVITDNAISRIKLEQGDNK